MRCIARAIRVRPHSGLAYLTPAAFKAKHLADIVGGRSPAMPARADVTKNGELQDEQVEGTLEIFSLAHATPLVCRQEIAPLIRSVSTA